METMIPKGMEEQEDITEEVETEAKKVKTEAWLLSEKNIPGGKYFFLVLLDKNSSLRGKIFV